MQQQAYFVISDITGYTAFLTGSEAEHAQEIIQSLMLLLVQHNRPPLKVSKLEGDAVFAYAPKGSFLQGQTFIELLENTYADFRKYREQMRVNTTCTCRACSNIPNLDLKFFLHYGSYNLMSISGNAELSGPDVILVHRLLKNSIFEKTGKKAYIYITETAMQALGLGPAFAELLIPHQEEIEHLGAVPGYVYCMHQYYDAYQGRKRCLVEQTVVAYEISQELPYPPALVWDHVTRPETRRLLMGADELTLQDPPTGRIDAGATYHCVHGNKASAQLILDWKPVEYYTWQSYGLTPAFPVNTTIFLEEQGSSTRLTCRTASVTGKGLIDRIQNAILSKMMRAAMPKGIASLEQRIRQDVEDQRVILPEASLVSVEGIAAEV